ncbi:hypothetical protein JTE90_009698 [Oedothorax gibbosus]|uniref:Clustered mitochondria protein homolog n=1 Tax=Oedothorax gibbosus TaxID=931172 RepID=A0AAV6V7K0_9ARAC|nr:hypothetical protein JTE90_009698 [Oedothorax gibbosus]
MVKDTDSISTVEVETVNGHTNGDENNFNDLQKKLKAMVDAPVSPYTMPKDKALENNGSVRTKISYLDEDPIQKLSSELVGMKNGKASDEKNNEVILDSGKDQEFVFIHDAGFVIKIVAPGVETFDIQVSSTELVQEIHQMLMDREETCHRTCFSLQLEGVTMDNFAELKGIEGLGEGSVIKVVEEPYTVREARIHVRHIRDLLKSLDPADAYNGVECSSFTFLNTITQGDILEKKKCRPDSVDCTPMDYILPGHKELPLSPLQPQSKDPKIAPALKVLTISGWNPPPGIRKLRGDLLYLYVVTAEDKRLHITASTRGFYINQTTDEEFNPKPASPKLIFHSLADLLSQVSPVFKRNFSLIQKKRTQRHPFERVATPYQVYTWTAPNMEHTVDSIRAEDAFSAKLGYEEHIPGQTRDWNEELQTTRELPRKTLPERLLRERAIFKVHSDFVTAATRGAMAVVDGNVMALNPGEETKMQMFIWNNIFFSLGFDVRDHYKEVGGDAAAFSAPNNDLQGVRAYNSVDVEGLYTLGTVVIDYRGFRVTAQSIIPGILEREQEHSVVYGSVDFGKTVLTNPKYIEMLNKAGGPLKIQPHSVVNEKGEEVELCSSVECKGIIGNDSRYYILDLLRTFPPDVNFLTLENEELSKEAQALGFPRNHRHKLCCLRQELIDAFVDYRYMTFIKLAAFHLQQLGVNNFLNNKTDKKDESKEVELDNKVIEEMENKNEEVGKTGEAIKKIVECIAKKDKTEVDNTREVIKKAANAVGSLKETEFDIRFNPDVFSPGVKHPDPEGEKLSRDKQLIKDASEFLLTNQIFFNQLLKNELYLHIIKDCLDHSTSPIDGTTLTEALHGRGISIRYLGKITDMVAKIPQLQYVHKIMVLELITRTAKHLFAHYIQGVETMYLSNAVSHFLNCLLSSCSSLPSPVSSEEQMQVKYKKKGKRKGKQNPLRFEDNNEWALLSTKTFWTNMKNELSSYYAWNLSCDTIDAVVEHFSLQKTSILRSFCIKTGVQLLLKEYNFDHRTKPIFSEDDVLNIFPVVKHINPRATDAYNFYTTGQTKIQQGFLKEGYELITEALNLLNNVYGAMHPEISQCLRMLARLNYIMGDHAEAMAFQQKAVLMSERVNGFDHAYTISEYTHLALYCFANSQITTALKLLYRARYLTLLICGENHPEMAVLDSNIGLILHAVGEYDLSLRFLENALKLNINYYGSKNLKVAVSYHLVARTQSCMGEFRGALQNEKETYGIYKQTLGELHDKTKESSECLRHLTQQAVVLQKKMNEIYKGNSSAILPPIQIQPPSLSSVLDMLNIINGILFVQISQQDIDNFKTEYERKQLSLDSDSSPASPKEQIEETNGHDSVAETSSNSSS